MYAFNPRTSLPLPAALPDCLPDRERNPTVSSPYSVHELDSRSLPLAFR